MKQTSILYHLRRLLFAEQASQTGDAELLGRFCSARDEDAFATLVQRHGPLVWRVCRRMLRDEHLAEDVFQAVFLVLSRRAASIRRPDALAGWLHGVATRLALKARLQASKRPVVNDTVEEPAAPDFVEEMTVRELRVVLDQELLQLPDKFRYPLVLCYLEGKTRDEAAQQLNCPLETLKSRLERGRELLQARLRRRQLGFSTALLSLLVAEGSARAGPATPLLRGTAEAAARFGSDLFVAGSVSARAQTLAQSCLSGMRLGKIKGFVLAAVLLGAVTMTGLLLAPALGLRPDGAAASKAADVFEGPPAPLVPRLRADVPAVDGPLRRLIVEERVGARRSRELVRVPLFFHEGECRDPHGLQVHFLADRERSRPIAYQPDDIRRAEDGSVSRMHVYFQVDLQPWERQQFVVIAGDNPGRKQTPLPVLQENGRVTLAGEDLQVSFWTEGARAGAIAALHTGLGKVTLPDELLGPRLTLHRQAADLSMSPAAELSYQKPETLEVRDLRFGAGPLFGKLIVRIGPRGLPATAEFTYLVPRNGSHLVQTERLFLDEPSSNDVVVAGSNALLAGRLVLGESAGGQRVLSVPAGLRRLTRSTQGQTNAALVNPASGISLFPVPCVQQGMTGIDLGQAGEAALLGSGDFKRTTGGSGQDLRAFWGQVRFVFSRATTEEALWDVGRAHFQPLTAVVEEPGLGADDLHQRLRQLMAQFPQTHARSWMQEAGRLYTLGDQAALTKVLASAAQAEETSDHWLNSARTAHDEVTKGGTLPLQEDQKGRASGNLNPWNLTYGATPMVALAARGAPSDRLDRICLAIGTAQRQVNGRVDGAGFPYIDCFNTHFNMQLGSIAAGIHGARQAGAGDLLQFYRDCARSPNALDLYGHAQRAKRAALAAGDPNDFMHESTADFYLRAVELADNEDLWLHPAVFGRYFDCVDVNADLLQREPADAKRPANWYRANYFRAQAHERRWGEWSAGPFLGVLGRADDRGSVGLSEACYYTRHLTGHSLNATEITTFFHADLALQTALSRYRLERAPALPGPLQVTHQEAGNVVRWPALDSGGILGYRVYRAERLGGPWALLNSPYTEPPGPLVPGTEFVDAGGKASHVYHVTAIDSQRRESRWFPDERAPVAGRD